jgi:hypothetical protein
MADYTLGTLTSDPTNFQGFVTPTDATDVFEIDLGSSGTINLSLTGITGGDADLWLYSDSNGNGSLDASDSLVRGFTNDGVNIGYGDRDEVINVQASSGTYFAQVSLYSGSSVSYNLAASSAPTNNLVSQENQLGDLSGDITRDGSVGDMDRSDTYAFSLGLYEGVDIYLSGLSNDADIRLIQDSNGNGSVDSGEVIEGSYNLGSLSETIAGIDYSGSYLLQVNQFSGDTSYQLSFDHYTTSYA